MADLSSSVALYLSLVAIGAIIAGTPAQTIDPSLVECSRVDTSPCFPEGSPFTGCVCCNETSQSEARSGVCKNSDGLGILCLQREGGFFSEGFPVVADEAELELLKEVHCL